MSSNTKKAATLGMPHGTASGRLRKNILFHLLKKHGENYCFKCSELIEEVEDLSIEHKKPWEGISADLFWDMNNIAFSHLRCNTPHRFTNNDHKKFKGPDGQSWCIGHQAFLPVTEFYKNASTWTGLAKNCKLCHDKQQGHGTVRGRVAEFNGAVAHLGERFACTEEASGAEPDSSTIL